MSKYIPDVIYFHKRTDRGQPIWTNPRSERSENYITQEVKNEPVDGVRITALVYVASQTFRIEFNLDGKLCRDTLPDTTLLDIMENAGIHKGVIQAPLIWAGSGKYPRLVRVDSQKHKEYLRKEYLSTIRPIKKKDLVAGHLYESQGGSQGVFLGHISTVKLCEADDILTEYPMPNQMLWFNANGISDSDLQKVLRDLTCSTLFWPNTMFEIQKSHSFKIEREEVYACGDIIEQLRLAAVEKIRNEMDRENPQSWYICALSAISNMSQNKTARIQPDVMELIKSQNTHYSRITHGRKNCLNS